MLLKKLQIKLLRASRSLLAVGQKNLLTKDIIFYLKKFIKQQAGLSRRLLGLLVFQGLAEISLVVLSYRYFSHNLYTIGAINQRNLLIILLIASAIYLFTFFYLLKTERTLTIRLINDLRQRWFKIALSRSAREEHLTEKSSLLAKISYHLPLLNMGINNSLLGALRWLLLVLILIFLAIIFGGFLILGTILAIIFSLVIAWLAYLVAKNYVSQETTFYSKIIRLVDFSLSDWQFTKKFNQERAILQEFNDLVELDSYFRVRRDLWLRFGFGIIFVLLILLAWLFSFFNLAIDQLLMQISYHPGFIVAIFIFYFSRLLYASLRLGLYAMPLFLGLFLSVPVGYRQYLGKKVPADFSQLIFTSSKIKLFKQAPRYQAFNFTFQVGRSYLIIGQANSGKTTLAKLFTGQGFYGRRAWLIKSQQQRYFYQDFFAKFRGFYYLDPKFFSHRSLLSVAAGKENYQLTDYDLTKIASLVVDEPLLSQWLSTIPNFDWRLGANKFLTTDVHNLLLQTIHCLFAQPNLIAIDNHWLDNNNQQINNLLALLVKRLPNSTLVFFARQSSNLCSWDKIYEI